MIATAIAKSSTTTGAPRPIARRRLIRRSTSPAIFVDTVNQVTVSALSESASGFVVRVANLGSKYRSYLPVTRR
jgi:hypothetical protein